MSEEYISTTALSKKHNMELSDLYAALNSLKWVERKDDQWIITELGRKKGGRMQSSGKGFDYPVWPSSIPIDEIYAQIDNSQKNLITVTKLAEHLKIAPQRLNLILSELGWIERDEVRAWTITKLGKIVGGKQKEFTKTGKFYVLWPDNILENKALHETLVSNFIIEEIKEKKVEAPKKDIEFREKFKADHRAQDGHMVRSKAEVIIDNYLYVTEIVHAYERKLPFDEEYYCDFYIPKAKLYIEYWGVTGDAHYDAKKKTKLDLYKKYDVKVISLTDDDVKNIDDKLPPLLRKHGIKLD